MISSATMARLDKVLSAAETDGALLLQLRLKAEVYFGLLGLKARFHRFTTPASHFNAYLKKFRL